MTRDVLVDGRTLFVTQSDRTGVAAGTDGGLFHRDTRHLSALSASVDGADVDAIGRDLPASNRRTVVAATLDSTVNRVDDPGPKRTGLVVVGTQVVAEGEGLAGRFSVTNHAASPLETELVVTFDADFADVFEVRGFSASPDRDVATRVGDRSVRYEYAFEAADGETVRRGTTVAFDRSPAALESGRAEFDMSVGSQETAAVEYSVVPRVEDGASPESPARVGPGAVSPSSAFDIPSVSTGRDGYDRVFERAGDDLAALTTDTDHGLVPLAGTPWFATPFGRDSLITAYQTLHVAPSLAAGTLRYLAAHQGTATDEQREEAPGKIFHEIRDGELAAKRAIPHTPYYGSVDATPLWVVLLAEYRRWTGDDALVSELAGALDAALSWIDAARGANDDPFLYYEQSQAGGLLHKGWRDTPGAVQFPDGELADPPIASVEVQGYVYRALRDAAELYAGPLDDAERARRLRDEADDLQSAFESAYWLPDREFYAVAVAGDDRVVPTLTSNVGHCLWADVVPEERAPAVADALLSDALFSGWGLRTMASTAAGYSPVSYHLGSVWPHDTSLAALGLARYGFGDDAERLARGVLDASTGFDEDRIPEVFCGFDDEFGPVPYPSSCVPQAWSAGAPFAFIRAVFGLEPTDHGVSAGRTPDLFGPEAVEPIREEWNP
ncbi:MAG: glycogen debranching N-terminal domain-containing protein [Haloarculaceae archaeon]